jgi:RHS repeat-associated protein
MGRLWNVSRLRVLANAEQWPDRIGGGLEHGRANHVGVRRVEPPDHGGNGGQCKCDVVGTAVHVRRFREPDGHGRDEGERSGVAQTGGCGDEPGGHQHGCEPEPVGGRSAANGFAIGAYDLKIDAKRNQPYYEPSMTRVWKSERYSFGSRRLNGAQGRIASWGKYYPYGEERSAPTANDGDKFATYFRDADTALDYAVNRYYDSARGRFLTPDPYRASASVQNPQSWNRYGYVENDHVNFKDPQGLVAECPECDFSVPTWALAGDLWGGGGSGDGNPMPQPMPWDLAGISKKEWSAERLQTFGRTITPIRVTNFSNTGPKQDVITAVLNGILAALTEHEDCANWLQGGDVLAQELVRVLVDNGSYGYGDFNTNSVAAFCGQRNADGSETGVPITAAFTVNSNRAFFTKANSKGQAWSVRPRGFSGGTLQAQASIVIHELAHILGAAGFKSDWGDSKAMQSNDKLVLGTAER